MCCRGRASIFMGYVVFLRHFFITTMIRRHILKSTCSTFIATGKQTRLRKSSWHQIGHGNSAWHISLFILRMMYQVHLDALMNFLFPPNIQHSNSTGRLFVFSLYGTSSLHRQTCMSPIEIREAQTRSMYSSTIHSYNCCRSCCNMFNYV